MDKPLTHLQPILTRRRRSGRWGALISLSLVGGALATWWGLAQLLVYRLTGVRKRQPLEDYYLNPDDLGIDHEVVRFPTAGGDLLSGWWLRQPEARATILACTGYRCQKSDTMGVSAALWRAGYNVLAFDYRGHGDLHGTPVTLGYREVEDFLAAVDYAAARTPDLPLGVVGFSMGAAVAIMGAARDQRVRAVLADSPFARQRDVVHLAVRRIIRVPGDPILALADWILGRRVGYRFRDVEPIREVARLAPRPLLLIHGGADTTVPARDSEALYAAAGEPKALWIEPGVEHCGVYFQDRRRYWQRISAFFAQAFAADPVPAGARPVPEGHEPVITLADMATDAESLAPRLPRLSWGWLGRRRAVAPR